MSEQVDNKRVFSLLEVSKSIQKTLNDRYTNSFWVKAEMNKLNFYKQSGHCFPELVEKKDEKVIAQIKSHLWKDDYFRIDHKFQTLLKEPLKDGIKILFQAKISFDPVYGLSLWILDIDPSFTLGDLEKEKQETINKLKLENLYERNKLLKLSLLPQRIAIISVESSKGYADFIDVISKNPWGYKFFHLLFPAILDGDKASADITSQLNRIKKVANHFDVVAIIRGGGGDVGLSCYNNYALAKTICTFPIPVITGIGHSTNETVTEMISFTNAITPTKLAEYLIQKFHNFSVPVQDAEKKIIDKANRLISDEKTRFHSEVKLFRSVTENVLLTNKNEVRRLTHSLHQQSVFRFKNEREKLKSVQQGIFRGTNTLIGSSKLELKNFVASIQKDTKSELKQSNFIVLQYQSKLRQVTETLLKQGFSEINSIDKNVNNMSPINVLRRGYSITLLNGKAIKDSSQIKIGDEINTTLFEGSIISVVNSTNKSSNNE